MSLDSTESVRVDSGTSEAITDLADDLGIPRSKALREVIQTGLENTDDLAEPIKRQVEHDRAKKEAKPKQRSAWRLTKVTDRLEKALSSRPRLSPQEAADAVSGYRSVAETEGREDQVEWIDGAIRAYRKAVEQDNDDLLQVYLNTGTIPGEQGGRP